MYTYTVPYVLTKMDISAMRKADLLLVGLNHRAAGESLVKLSKTFRPSERCPFGHDSEHVIAAPVVLHYGAYGDDTSHIKCWGHVSLYADQQCIHSSVLATLRAGDGIKFEFYPDHHTTGGLANAGFHGDALRLQVYRGDKLVAKFVLDTCTSPDNTARMCKGAITPAWIAKVGA
jgi:hypothetical protein